MVNRSISWLLNPFSSLALPCSHFQFLGVSSPSSPPNEEGLILFVPSANDNTEFQIADTQPVLNIDESQSPVMEGLKYYRPPIKRAHYKKKPSEPQGKTVKTY